MTRMLGSAQPVLSVTSGNVTKNFLASLDFDMLIGTTDKSRENYLSLLPEAREDNGSGSFW